MLFKEFKELIDFKYSVVLLEGKRKVHPFDQPRLTELGEVLCKELKYVKFRSGNADGADYWFCKGVANIDPKRLELILPYSAHRKKYLLSENIYSLDKIDLIKEPEVVYQTKTNSKNNRLI